MNRFSCSILCACLVKLDEFMFQYSNRDKIGVLKCLEYCSMIGTDAEDQYGDEHLLNPFFKECTKFRCESDLFQSLTLAQESFVYRTYAKMLKLR